MKKNIRNIIINHYKNKFLLKSVIFIFVVLIATCLSFIIFIQNISKNQYLRSSYNKLNIKNQFLSKDSNATINSIFINTTPDNKKDIYIGGINLKDSKNTLGALVKSTDNGITWTTVSYFVNSVNSTPKNIPIINKIKTEFYTDADGTSDSIIVMGKYLASIAISDGIGGTGNGNSACAGQVAHEKIYYAKTGTKINEIDNPIWTDIASMDFDSSAADTSIKGLSQKVITIETIKRNVISQFGTSNYSYNTINIVTNDENIDVNNKINIPYKKADGIWNTGSYKFYLYQVIENNDNTQNINISISDIGSHFLNPITIYGKVIIDTNDPSKDVVTPTAFNPDATSFVLFSGVNALGKEVTNNKIFIVENQHFDKSSINTEPSFDNPLIIEYSLYSVSDGAAQYLWNNTDLSRTPELDNFLIKTISINPMSTSDDGNDNKTFLIFGGEKNNVSCIENIILDGVNGSINPLNLPFPDFPTEPSFEPNENSKSYITNIISFPIYKVPISKNASNIKTTIVPLVIFGKNISSSNDNIGSPYSDYTFTPNKQNLTNQGILLANFHLVETTDIKTNRITKTSFVSYSQIPQFNTNTEVQFVKSSNLYSTSSEPSLSINYTFVVSTFDSNKFAENKNILFNFKIIFANDGSNNYNFISSSSIRAKKNNNIIKIVIPVVVIVLVLVMMTLFMFLFFHNKRKKYLLGRNNKSILKGRIRKHIFFKIINNSVFLNKFINIYESRIKKNISVMKKKNIFKDSKKYAIIMRKKGLNISDAKTKLNIYLKKFIKAAGKSKNINIKNSKEKENNNNKKG